jgi:hypothetical protein
VKVVGGEEVFGDGGEEGGVVVDAAEIEPALEAADVAVEADDAVGVVGGAGGEGAEAFVEAVAEEEAPVERGDGGTVVREELAV